MKKYYYAGIGSRQTPNNILKLMTNYAIKLRELNYILRSGGAVGADTAFERGAGKEKEIYLPWKGFNKHTSRYYNITKSAFELASKYHPYWDYLKPSVQKLMARNCYQILGYDLAIPVDFVICWTPDGCETINDRTKNTGGTGIAIALADSYNIRVFNLKNKTSQEELENLLLRLE